MSKIKYYSIVMLIALYSTAVYSQKPWCVKAGVNISSFTDYDDDSIRSLSIGISRDFPIEEIYSIMTELIFTTQGGAVNNVLVTNPQSDQFQNVYDITAQIVYIEIPVVFTLKVINTSFSTKIYTGPSFRIGISDLSDEKYQGFVQAGDGMIINEEQYNNNVNFTEVDFNNSSLRIVHSGIGLNVGLLFEYKFLSFDIMYGYALHQIGQLGQYQFVNKNTHATHFLLGVNF